MGSCVSKKAARAGRDGNKAAALPLPPPPVMNNALSPVAEEQEEEEVKEVVLSETPAAAPPPRLPESPVKTTKRQAQPGFEEEGSEAGSESASVGSVAKEKEKAMAKLGGEQEVVKRAVVDAPEKARAPTRTASPTRAPPEGRPKPNKQGGARSPSPRRQQRPRREPAVVSAFGCRSGRFSPSAAGRAAESAAAVRRSQSAREADMALPARRALMSGNAVSRRGPGERSESPTASKRPSPAPSPVHRHAARRAAARDKESSSGGTPERSSSRPRDRDVAGPEDAGDKEPALFAGGGEQKKPGEQGALGQNPSVAMECFIFL